MNMTDKQISEWQKIENEIYTVFSNVRLGDGIGYYEAGALDDYLQPTDLKYQQEKAKDERDDWKIMLITFEHIDYLGGHHCFMDEKGLLFYLPFLMIRKDPEINSILYFYISSVYHPEHYPKSKYIKMVSLLTKEQKQCIYHFYDFLSKIEYPEFQEDELNAPFDTGEAAMKDFSFMDFIRNHFDVK
jgi:hypothetical protein